MTQLFYVLGGWLGLLTRGSVLLQVLLAVVLLAVYRLWIQRHPSWGVGWRDVLAKLAEAGLLALLTLPLSALVSPSPPGCQLFVAPDLVDIALSAGGAVQVELPLPADPALATVPLFFQMFALDGAAPGGIASSRGYEFFVR